MKFQSQINLRLFIKLHYILFYKRAAIIYITIAGIIMLITSLLFYLGIAVTIYKDNPPTFQLILGFFFVCVFPVTIYFSAKKSYYSPSQRLQEKIEYEFTGESFKMIGDSFKTELSWDKIYKIQELSEWFLIYQNKHIVNPIPKQDLTNEQIVYLRNLFRNFKNLKVKLKK